MSSISHLSSNDKRLFSLLEEKCESYLTKHTQFNDTTSLKLAAYYFGKFSMFCQIKNIVGHPSQIKIGELFDKLSLS